MQENHLESVTFSTQFISITIIVPSCILLPGQRTGGWTNVSQTNEFQAPSLEAGISLLLNQGCHNASLNSFPLKKFQWKSEMLLQGRWLNVWGTQVFFCLLSAPKREELTQEWLSGSEVHLLLTVPGNSPQRGCFISSADFVFPGWLWANHCTSPSLSLFTCNMGISVPTLQGFCQNSVRQYADSLAQVCGYG